MHRPAPFRVFTAIATCMLLSACTGESGIPASQASQPKSAAQQAQSVSGVVYARSDDVAYEANYVPSSGGLANAQLSLAAACV